MKNEHGTGIDWTHHAGFKGETWNPFIVYDTETDRRGWHCRRISPACENCYAASLNKKGRFQFGTGLDYHADSEKQLRFAMVNEDLPLRQTKPRCYFVGSMTDIFGPWWPREYVDRLISVMLGACCIHRFLLLTKRPYRMASFLKMLAPNRTGQTLPNIWVGVTIENEEQAERFAPIMARIKAMGFITYISYEPALSMIDWEHYFLDGRGLNFDWLICGGESGGRDSRPVHPEWFRRARDICRKHGKSFFFKQWGSFSPVAEFGEKPSSEKVSVNLDGTVHTQYSSFYVDPLAAFMTYAGASPKAGGCILDGSLYKEIPNPLESEHLTL